MAEEVFKSGVHLPGLAAEETISLKYELALLYEEQGRSDEALGLYREIRKVAPRFRDAAEKVAALGGGGEEAEGDDLDLVELEHEEIE